MLRLLPNHRGLLAAFATLTVCALASASCAVGGGDDAGTGDRDAGPLSDAGRTDAGRDAGRVSLPDAGPRDAAVDSGRVDAGPRTDSGPRDAGPPGSDAGRDAGGPSTCVPTAAAVEISEVMVASRSGAGDLGEWFEIHNRSSCTINLAGLSIVGTNSGGAAATYDVPNGILTAGGFFVLAQSGQSAENGALAFDHVYGASGISFSNSGDSVAIAYGGDTLDSVAWGSVDHRTATSRQLRPGQSGGGSLGNATWCDANSLYSTDPLERRGTPGSANLCP